MFGSRPRASEETLQERSVSVENVVGMNLPRISVCENNLSTFLSRIDGLQERLLAAEARIPLPEPVALDVASEHEEPPASKPMMPSHRGEGAIAANRPNSTSIKTPASVTITQPMDTRAGTTSTWPKKFLAPTPKKDTNPITSVIVVTNTLDAIAGSIFIFFKVTGTRIPNRPATTIVNIIEIEIIIES